MAQKNKQHYWWIMLTIACFSMWFGGLMYEKFGNIDACRMCLVQRGMFLLIGVLSALTGLMGEGKIHKMLSMVTLVALGVLFFLALYHAGLQYHWIRPARFCSVHHSVMSLDKLLGTPSASCHERTLDIFGIPASVYSVIFSAFSFVVSLMFVGQKKGR